MAQGYKAPYVSGGEVTPQFVRDELLKCFESANREFAQLQNQPVTNEQLKQQVTQFVKGVFTQCGVSYVNPTKEGILSAISQCKANAETIMGPAGAAVIDHHYKEMMKLMNHLE